MFFGTLCVVLEKSGETRGPKTFLISYDCSNVEYSFFVVLIKAECCQHDKPNYCI